MDTKIIPKRRLPGAIWVTTVALPDNQYTAAMLVKADDDRDELLETSGREHGSRHAAAVDAKEWASRADVEYQPAGTDI